MRKFILAAAAVALLGTAAVSTAAAGLSSGPQIGAIQTGTLRTNALAAAVTLPSGQLLGLDADTATQPRLRFAGKKALRDRAKKFEDMVRDKTLTDGEYSTLQRMRLGTPVGRAPIQGPSVSTRRR